MTLSASWIWLDPELHPNHQKLRISSFDPAPAPGGMAVFRRKFRVEAPAGCVARFSGDCKYRLWVNEAFVCDGPPEVGGDYDNRQAPDWWLFDTLDLSSRLVAGENVIEAEVLMDCEAQTDYSSGRGGFIFELRDGEGELLLATGGDWEARRNDAWRPGCYDAAREPEGDWWEPAAVIADPPWRLLDLGLPPLATEAVIPACECALPHTFPPGVPQTVMLRFDRKVCGHFEFTLTAGAAATVGIAYAEIPGIFHESETEYYSCKVGRQHFRATRMRVCMEIRLTITHGSFLTNGTASVTLHDLGFTTRNFPVFLSPLRLSDPYLNRLRECCADTLRFCMQRLHLDSPIHQEGLGCTGDYMISSLMSYYLFGESRLAAADIRRTALLLKQKLGVLFHTGYTLLWVSMVHDYVLYTGDRELLREVFGEIRLVLELFDTYTGTEGLVSQAPNYMFVDWVNLGGFAYHHPPASHGMGVMTAFYIHALTLGAELARWNETPEGEWCDRAERLKRSFRRELWCEEAGVFRNGVPGICHSPPARFLPPDDGVDSFSQHCNIAALACGVLAPGEERPFLDRILNHAWPVRPQPYFMHFVFDAVRRADAFDRYGRELLMLWKPLLEEHPHGLKECWNCGDYCHAWGGTPAIQLGRDILGVEPQLPGFEQVLLAPHPCGLESASGKIRTPLGGIEVEWRIENGLFQYRARFPEGMAYEFRPPAGFRREECEVEILQAATC